MTLTKCLISCSTTQDSIVYLLTDEDATKVKIDKLMTDVIPTVVTARDRFLFYWSGHGDQRFSGDGRPFGFLPSSDSKSKEFSAMVSMRDLERWDSYIEARQALFVLDACLSGLAGFQTKGPLNPRVEQLSLPARHLITAGTKDESVIASDRWGGSLFTDSFILGAKGQARSPSGIVTLPVLWDFIQERVAKERELVNWSKSLTPQIQSLQHGEGYFFFTPVVRVGLPPSAATGQVPEQKGPQTAVVPQPSDADRVSPVRPRPAQASPTPAPQAALRPSAIPTSCSNPNALGISRVVEIDTTGGPGFGLEHFKSHDFLREGEIVLTFDDGPWPKNTPAVLAALAAHCTKAIFFPIGLHATYEPGILKQVAADGHAIGSHTWCHQDLSKTTGRCQVNGKTENVEYDPRDEIEKGISAVRWAVGGPTAPYFRFPALRQPQELVDYLGKRNIAIFSTDIDSFDFKLRQPEQVRQSVMAKLKKNGKGIVLMHDFQHAMAEAAMDLLNDLKAGGYRVVFMKPKFPVTTIASYDEVILKLTSLQR
jgi:peptidoglycan/xylan/chitin deacetylase (PgdA/CDA1 family)